MPVITMKHITREDLQGNPDVLYLFGDNDRREGYGGQAREMRDEENSIGIRTKWEPTRRPEAYFSDDDYGEIIAMIQQDLEPARNHLEAGKIVVIPADGLGTGLANLPECAPRVYEFLQEQIAELSSIR